MGIGIDKEEVSAGGGFSAKVALVGNVADRGDNLFVVWEIFGEFVGKFASVVVGVAVNMDDFEITTGLIDKIF
mgnify:CR=1 FL=1